MRINSTVVLTLILLTLMMGAGSVSAFLGFNIGSKALKGVTTPDSRPTTKFTSSQAANLQYGQGVALLKEQDILKVVKARIEGKTKAAKLEKADENDEADTKRQQEDKSKEVNNEKPQLGFPVTAQSDGVSFSVQSAHFSGGALLLKVKMQNQGSDSVRFLYSFLDVTDDQGQTLTASTDGLPEELPAKSSAYTGTVSIPTALLDDVKKISLSLTDYPAQKLRLSVSNIPVER